MKTVATILICFCAFGFTYVSNISWQGENGEVPENFQKLVNRKLVKHFKVESIILKKSDRELMSANKQKTTPYYNVYNEKEELLAHFVFNITDACSFGGCAVPGKQKSSGIFHDKIYYYVILNTDYTVQDIKVLEHESSYGMEIGTRYWLKQFFNTKPGNYKLGDNIDGISGATVSVQAMIDDLNGLTHLQ
ncbi:MAG: FMN-binding protein [Bacteroidia bacterium]|nr:FMN-binding protein [Bacteroidia bacterium]NNC84956.1 FMN-binding protein [Bacteroidia bacterium]NNM16346.1 FMN-binding protein [Bacteroidia bacterium]